MQESMYSAMFGALTQEHRLDIIANNLANVNTAGYKQERQAFEDVFISYAHDDIREPMMNMRSKQMFPDPDYYAKPRIAECRTDFSQGSLKQTGNDLDVALFGEGFFKVRNEDGDEFYTRDGAFTLTPEGRLINGRGDTVLGEDGPIELPPNTRITIDGSGAIYDGQDQVGTLSIVSVDKLEGLRKYGKTYFELPEDGKAVEVPMPEGTMVRQGYLEAPNVDLVMEMVNMIETQRAFEAYQKVITTTGETDQRAMQKVGASI